MKIYLFFCDFIFLYLEQTRKMEEAKEDNKRFQNSRLVQISA